MQTLEEYSVHSNTTTAEAVIPPKTNRVFRLTFSWGYDTSLYSSVDHFDLMIGTNSGEYTIVENAGTNLSYTFTRTNWSERSLRHYAAVVARTADPELFDSLESNEVHAPDYAPDHFRLTWENSWPEVRVLTSPDLQKPIEQWQVLASLTNANKYEDFMLYDAGAHFFRLDKPDRVALQPFNPTP